MKFLFLAVFALAAPVLAQTDAITVTASRTVDLSPDEITFSMALMTDPATSLEQVLEAGQPLGLVASDLLSINSQQFGPSPNQTQLVYVFGFTSAFSKFRETNDKLASLRRSLAANTPPMDVQIYSISVSPSDAARERARQGLLSQLFTDARQRGEQLARAAGVNLGGILGVSEAAGAAASAQYGPYGPFVQTAPGALRTTFSLSVRYAVK